MASGRLLIHAPASGARNMAIDEALLESVGVTGIPCLRFYAWETPTLSLGYFQPLAERERHAASRDLPVVRRVTGGGAIVHDRELTYSLTLPIQDRWAAAHRDLYDRVHDHVVSWLSSKGLTDARLHPGMEQQAEPFLCFCRRAAGDVEAQGSKLLGSAQRRTRSALLQHGSVLLMRSSAAEELAGITDLLEQDERGGEGPTIDFRARGADSAFESEGLLNRQTGAARVEELAAELREVIARSIDVLWERSELTQEEVLGANRWEQERFLAPFWTERR